MPLFAASSVPGSIRNAADPGVHMNTAPVVRPAAPVVESVPLDRPEPKVGHPDVTRAGPSLEVPSPELQPGNGSPPSPEAPSRPDTPSR